MGFLKPDKDRIIHEIGSQSTLWRLLNEFLAAYRERTQVLRTPPIGETSIGQKLDAIIEMLRSLTGVPGQLGLVKDELETVHGLVSDLKNSLPHPPGPPAKVEFVKFVFPGLKESE